MKLLIANHHENPELRHLVLSFAEGKKELLVIDDGYRQSEASWKKVLLDLKTCMLKIDPQLAIGDGALG
ncbi:MAG: hypothetical protein NTAFB09_16970 [Nitrosospira sp.]